MMKRDYLGNPFKDGDVIRVYLTTPPYRVVSYGWLIPMKGNPLIEFDLLKAKPLIEEEEEHWILVHEVTIKEIDGALFEEIHDSEGWRYIVPLYFLDRFISSRDDVVVTIKGISDSKEMYYANMHKRD